MTHARERFTTNSHKKVVWPPAGDHTTFDQALLTRINRFSCLRQDVEQVANDTVVCELKDRSFCILVDCNNVLRGLHTSAVLDCAGNTSSNVQLRRNDLTGLTNLVRVWVPASVNGGTRGTDGSAERVCQSFDWAKVSTGTASTGNNNRCFREVGATRGGLFLNLLFD